MRDGSGQTDVDRVREATDLVALIGEHVRLSPRGREHVGLCPFHEDRRPSFAVVTHKGQAFYKCHACGAAGDAYRFVMEYHRKDFREALEFLAQRSGITLTPRGTGRRGRGDGGSGEQPDSGPDRSALRRVNAAAAAFFKRVLEDPERGAGGRTVVQDRSISPEMVEQFQIGLAPTGYHGLLDAISRSDKDITLADAEAAGLLKRRREGDGQYDAFRNRLIFPICDEMGNPIAFGGRAIDADDQPKYLNSAESEVFHKSRTLYGLHLARRSIIDTGRAVVTEGYTDVIACHQAGITNVVGTLGTALTPEHARLLSRLCDTVVLVFDGDEAGQKAADRGVEVFFLQPVDIRICVLPEGLDPDDLLRREDGPRLFAEALEAAEDALTFKVARFARSLAGRDSMAGREKLLRQFLEELADLGFSTLQGVKKRWTLTRLAELLKVPVQDIEAMLPRRRPTRRDTHDTGRGDAPTELIPTVPGPTVSRARHLAEHDVLAVLASAPETGLEPVSIEEGPTALLTTLVRPDDFIEPNHRAIAAVVFARLEAGMTFSVAELLEAVHDEETRRVASALYFEGERRCEAADAPELALAEATGAMLRYLATERYRHQAQRGLGDTSSDQQLDALRELIERRRSLESVANAISSEVRT